MATKSSFERSIPACFNLRDLPAGLLITGSVMGLGDRTGEGASLTEFENETGETVIAMIGNQSFERVNITRFKVA